MEITLTPFLENTLKVYQPETGYRFGIDSVLLANFINLKYKEKILELCAGSGIISLIALKRFPKVKVYTLEIENLFIKCLKLNAKENNLEDRFFVIKGDINFLPFKSGFFDVVFTNPPYFKPEAGRLSPYEKENIARKELNFSLSEFIKKVSLLLKNRGRFYLIFTAFRLAELIFLLKKHKLEPKIIRFVHSYPGSEAKLVLILSVKNAGEETRILPPLFIYEKKKGNYTQEVKNYLKKLEN
ncbi:MAG: hypothetical protein DRP29_02095 [Thermodesulfobacteriota bacterium]|nr:MAG: hypothetical protein DRP29_02095 [Thermodesulfobacteriota bacterium]